MDIAQRVPDRTAELVRSRDELGLRKKELRLAEGLSRESAADRAGIHRTYWSSLARGHRNVGLDNIFRIAGALEVAPSRLFGG